MLAILWQPGKTRSGMKSSLYIPDCLESAGHELRLAFRHSLSELPKDTFVRVWCSVAYLFPGLHPDGFDKEGSGWPRLLKPVAIEAWRRAGAGQLRDEELYPSDAQWSGLYDRMQIHLPDETRRRVELAAAYGDPRF